MFVHKEEDSTESKDVEKLKNAMDEYATSFLRTAKMVLKDDRDAQETVSDTFLKYYQNIDSFRGECSLKTYLLKILINQCRQKLRSAWLRRVVPVFSHEELSDKTEEVTGIDIEEKISLYEAVMTLKPKERQVVVLYYYNQLTIKEIACALKQKEGTIKSRLSRARESLKIVLKEEYLYEEL
ncbi:sigma-70 family RNA polymerase sigma factor [Petroclostridium sp. X23]|uniref:sigma-70 family RNA polymerase sigma factor n=1 Tax=Petroclostridium sp. X23 TaxID=3045146 RepID=UPI0024ACAAD0|nr:sigma-70 family RNA polymerase sigma factor [Petroclostridium sp. X23]WHH58080.1 sigma-70 family RNA polymerase sigma factor [Petroclostridium sp. X23]